MGLACVEGVGMDTSGSSGVWARRGHKNRSVGRASRRLLSTTEPAGRNLQIARQHLVAISASDSARWNFDFSSMTPLPGSYTWVPVDENTPLVSLSALGDSLGRRSFADGSTDQPQAKRQKLHHQREEPCHLSSALSPLDNQSPHTNVLTSNNNNNLNNQRPQVGTTTTSLFSPAAIKTTPTTTNTIVLPTSTIPATTTTTTTSSTSTPKSPSKKHHLKRLRQGTSNGDISFRQTLCTDFFKKVKSVNVAKSFSSVNSKAKSQTEGSSVVSVELATKKMA